MSCPYCESPFPGSHFGDCRVSENKPRPAPRIAQCVDCAWRMIELPMGGHCYMFKDAPTERCHQRKPHLGRPVELFDESVPQNKGNES